MRSLSLALLLVAFPASALAQDGAPSVPPGYENAPLPPPDGAHPDTLGQPVQTGAAAYPAQPAYPVQPVTPSEPELHSFSLTISPVHLIFPIVELTADFRLMDELSLSAIFGIGSVPIETSAGDVLDHAFALEVGTQLKFYAVGDFDHGLELGLEGNWIYISTDFDGGGVTGTGSGLAIGPFIGYKWVASFGLTIDIQGGVQVAGIAASATDGTTTEEESRTEVIPLLNLNFGWSF